MTERPSEPIAAPAGAAALLALITSATVLGFAATDLILPAIPGLPQSLGGTPARAQFVLASFTAGVALGLLLFGELAARWHRMKLLAAALLLFALASFASAFAPSLDVLIGLRFVQGMAASAAAVIGPALIKAMYPPQAAVRALGLQSSVEALAPALAPIAGAWLLQHFDWRASFFVLGALCALMAAAFATLARGRTTGPNAHAPANTGSYRRLLANREFQRWGWSQACTLGALLVIVFGAPAVMVGPMGGSITDFIWMQVMGVASFIAAANVSGRLSQRVGVRRIVLTGSAVSAAGACAMLAYALAGGNAPFAMALLFVPINLGLGLRGPPGFFQAITVAGGDDARAAALVVFAILLTTAAGTALAAPWIALGLAPLAGLAAVISVASVVLLLKTR